MERPLEVRQLDALKDWLREGSWMIREAACILVGVLPRERVGDADRPFGAWLPGCEPWEEGRDSWVNWIAQEIDHIETVLRENRPQGAMGPKDYLSLAAYLDISPPWLPAALADAGCRSLTDTKGHAVLPDSLFLQSDPGEKVMRPLSEANRKKRLDQLATDDMQKLFAGDGRNCFDELAASGFVGLRTADGEPVVAQIARAVRAAMVKANDGDEKGVIPVPRTVENRVKEWLEELDSERAGAGTESAPAKV